MVIEADFLEKVEVYLVAAKRINNECNNKKLTFSSCATRQGRYHNFKKSLKTPDVRILPGSTDETPAAVRNAVGQFGPDFSRLFSGYSSNLASKISLSGFNFHNVVINKGVLWGERRITSYVECDERGERNTAYAYGADTKIFFHKPSQVICTKPVWSCDQEQKFTNKSWKGSISLSVATLTDESEFDAVAAAEYKFRVTKGISAKPVFNVLTLGLTALTNEEKTLEFDSSQFQVQFLGVGPGWFKVWERPKINISKEAATDFLEKANKLRQYQAALKMTAEMKMVEDQREAAIGEVNDDAAAEQMRASINATLQTMAADIDLADELEQPEGHLATWVMSATATMRGERLNVRDYHMTLKFLDSSQEAMVLEVARSAEAASTLQAGANRAVTETASKKYQIALDNPQFSGIQRNDLNALGSFAFEELVTGKVLAEAIKEGVALETIMGDGIGQITNQAGSRVNTPEYVDVIFQEKGTGHTVSVQYKHTHNEFNTHADGTRLHNADAMVQDWRATWQEKGPQFASENQLPPELHIENVRIVAPKDSAAGASSSVKGSVEIGELEVSTPTVHEIDKFLENNLPQIQNIGEKIRTKKALEKECIQFDKRLKKLERTLENKMSAKDNLKSRGRSTEKLDGDIKKTLEDMETLKTTIENKVSELNHSEDQLSSAKTQNANSDLVNAETERGRTAQEQADQHAKDIVAKKQAAKRSARKELKQALILAAAISAGTELCISLAEEIKLFRRGEQTFGQMAGKVCQRTAKATAIGVTIGGGMAVTQYALVRMAASQSVSEIYSGTELLILPLMFSV